MAVLATDPDRQRRDRPTPGAPPPRRGRMPRASTLVLAGALAFCGARLATQFQALRATRTDGHPMVVETPPPRATESALPPAIVPPPAPPAPAAPAGPEPAGPVPHALAAVPAPAAVPALRRVVVHYDPHSVTGRVAAQRIAASLRDGPGLVETREVPATPRAPDVRYFFPEDAAPAHALAAALSRSGESWRVRDMGGYRPLPRRGTIEVWVP